MALLFVCGNILHNTPADALGTEHERTVVTISEEAFQELVKLREQGLAGFHKNVDPTSLMPAPESFVLNWSNVPDQEKNRLKEKQEEMFRQGKITMIVMGGGEATRFGKPKLFVSVAEDLGEFLEIKAANFNWMQKTYGTNVPLYILANENRLEEFKSALAARHNYGLDSKTFHWYVQGTVDTFIPSDAELKANFNGRELETHLAYAAALRQANPDGIYRFNGERRKVPAGHFDTIAAFIISGYLSQALTLGIEFAPVVNIDNLQAILKNDGMIAYFAERGDDMGFLLTEKNLFFTVVDKANKKVLQNKLIVRFRDNALSFDGLDEFSKQAEKDGYIYVINQESKSLDVYETATGKLIDTHITSKPEIGGTLVQIANEKGEPIGDPMMKEGFELPLNFDHANTPFFNTNTIVLNLRSLLKFLAVSQEQLEKMNFDQRSALVQEKLLKPIKTNFEFKNHEVEGEYPHLGIVKNAKTKIPVVQATRIMLQIARLDGAKIGYIFAPRTTVWTPVREPEDLKVAAKHARESLQEFTLYQEKNQ